MMRARYHDQETDEYSSGPWTNEVTQRIRNAPPAAPTGLTASEVSDSSVTLSWTAPSNSGITGYRVMRGLTAAKQNVLVNNTGSTETGYADSDVQAGTEYHYSVRAINDAGVGPASNTMAVTTNDGQTIGTRAVGTVSFSPTQPDMGIPITASVTDADTPVTAEMWQWSKSDTASGTYTDITGATSATYRPAEADLEKFLKASVTYTDSQAAGNTSSAVTSSAVQVRDTILVDNLSNVEIARGNPGLSQGLTTGGHPEGYKISGVTISTQSSQSSLVVKIFSSSSNANHPSSAPASELYELTYRSKSGSNHQTWDLQTGTRLDPNTAYHVVLLPANGRSRITCLGPDSAASSGATDWSLISTIRSTTATGGDQSLLISGTCSLRIRGEAAKDGPHITDLSYSSEPTQPPTYDTSDTIKVEATFSEAVTVSTTNPPMLPLKIGSNTRSATYLATDSTTTKLVFSYAVVAGDQDNDGITIEQNTLTGGITRHNSTVVADLDHNADSNNPDRLVNAAPTVTKVELTSSPVAPNWYTTGETIEVTVTFSIPITVTGDPVFRFALDGVDTPTVYTASASEPNTMVFHYTVIATDEDTNGIWLGDQSRTFQLDSNDSIKDALRTTGEKDAVLTHGALSTQGSHRISPMPRLSLRVTSDPRSGSGSDTYGLGEMIEFTATFNQDITVTGDPQHAFSLLDDGRDSTNERRVADYQASLSGTRTAVFTYTVVATDSDDNGIFLWGHGGGNTSFDLDSNDTIQNSANADAVLDYARHGTQSGHKVDGSLTPPSVPSFPDEDSDEVILASSYTGNLVHSNSSAGFTKMRTHFTTGDNEHGYRLTKVTHSIRFTSTSATAHIGATVNEDNAGELGTQLYAFPDETFLATNANAQTMTHTGYLFLKPNKKYWIVISKKAGTTTETLLGKARDEDLPTAQPEWTLAASSATLLNEDWTDLDKVLQIRLEGIVRTSTILISNYTGAYNPGTESRLLSRNATPFTTGNSELGYLLTKVTHRMRLETTRTGIISAEVSPDINGEPGASLYEFPQQTITNTTIEAVTHVGEILLEPNRKYWIVVRRISHPSERIQLYYKTSDDVDTGQPGWILSTTSSHSSGLDWETLPSLFSLRLEGFVLAPTTDEPDSRDFPMDASTPRPLADRHDLDRHPGQRRRQRERSRAYEESTPGRPAQDRGADARQLLPGPGMVRHIEGRFGNRSPRRSHRPPILSLRHRTRLVVTP